MPSIAEFCSQKIRSKQTFTMTVRRDERNGNARIKNITNINITFGLIPIMIILGGGFLIELIR